MKKFINLSIIDRMIRLILSEILLILGFFWLYGILQIILLVFGFILLFTGVIGYCGLYKIIGIDTYKNQKNVATIYKILFSIIFLLIAVLGSYFSIFFSKKFFIEDYNTMNNYYKQTLFYSGKEKREETISNYDLLLREYKVFLNKYKKYHPYVLKGDPQFNNDLDSIDKMIKSLKSEVYTGNLKNSHLEFEKIRPIFQDILKRNDFSLLAINLVDFHDVMEKVIDAADKKDSSGVLSAYIEADEKLKAVESEANDDEIKAIRKSLEDVKTLASNNETDKLSEKAAELKSNFVKVYLKRG